VFLHGIPDFWASLLPLAEKLNPSGQNIFLDLPGFNGSQSPDRLTGLRIDRVVPALQLAISRLSREPVVFVGHDWGGVFAWWLWLTRATGIDRFVTISAPHPAAFVKSMSDDVQWTMSGYARNLATMPEPIDLDLPALASWPMDAAHREALLEALQRSDPNAIAGYYRMNYPLARNYEISGVPGGCVPLLLLYGRSDPYVAETTFLGALDFANDKLEVGAIDGGHFIHLLQVPEVAAAVKKWMDE